MKTIIFVSHLRIIINQITMTELNKTLNWLQPRQPKTGGRTTQLGGMFLTIKRYVPNEHENPTQSIQRQMRLSADLFKKIEEIHPEVIEIIGKGTEREYKEFKIGFALGDEGENYVTFNPKGGIPSWPAKQKKTYAVEVASSTLIDDIWAHYKLGKDEDRVMIKVEPSVSIQGVRLFKMHLCDRKGKPYFSK